MVVVVAAAVMGVGGAGWVAHEKQNPKTGRPLSLSRAQADLSDASF